MPQTSIHYTQGFKYALGWNRFNLSCVGAWPDSSDGFFGKHNSLLCGFWILIMVYLPRSASIIIFWGDMDAVITCLSINGPLLVTIGKLWIMYYHREVMRMVIAAMAKDWAIPLGKAESEVMWRIARISRGISIGSASLTNVLFVAFVVFEICLGMQLKNRMELEPRSSIGALYPAYFPYDTRRLEYFLPTWMGQCLCTGLAMIAYAAFDSVMALMVLHVCGQLELMGISMTDLINASTRMNRQEFSWRFAELIKRHEELNRIAKLIENSFNYIFLPQMVVCTISFCFQGYTMLSVSDVYENYHGHNIIRLI
uniref:Olfactory receptor 84 n=1 Tax=Meteorus pulchricornis TaxID=51522 RepID=A0A1S5VFR5_9HYME|nr:olfactory receptor 84 [Meteorus pulchricornis]